MVTEEELGSPFSPWHPLDKTKQRSTAYSKPLPLPQRILFSNTRATVDPSGDVGTSTHQVFHI